MEKSKAYLSDRAISSVGYECTGEYVLPDYNTDVKRILHVGCRAVPSGGFINGENLELCGVLAYDVVYLDAEGEITSLDFCTDYDIKLRCDSDKYVDSHSKIDVSSYNIRLSGPRKISARASLQASVHILEQSTCEPTGDVFELHEPEIATESIPVRSAVFSERLEREYAEQLCQLDAVIADEVHVLRADCKAVKCTTRVVEGGFEHKGELNASALIKIDGQIPFQRSVCIPFNEVIPLDGAPVDGECGVDLVVTSVSCNVVPNDDGVSIVASVITDSRAYSFFNQPLVLLTDCYLKDRATENEYADFVCNEHMCTACSEDEISIDLPLSDNEGGDIRNFLMMDAVPRVENAIVGESSVSVEGQIRFSGIACQVSDENSPGYTAAKFDVPFSINVSNCLDGCRAECYAFASDVSAMLDDKSIYLACTLSTTVLLGREHRKKVVEASTALDETFESSDSVITVYYPKEGDTLFDIAKKYHTSVDEIAMANRLDEAVFSGVRSPSALQGLRKLIIK